MSRDPGLTRLGTLLESSTRWPRPACATCREGHLRFGDPKEFENAQSARMRGEEGWEPEWTFGTFRAEAVCENTDCRQVVIAVGTYHVDHAAEYDPHDFDSLYATFYRVEYLTPALPLIQVPNGTPEDVQDGVLRASRLLFADPGAAATALRATVERYMTTAGISGAEEGGGFVSLAERIRRWEAAASERKEVSGLLTAIRWIGNEGTHEMTDLRVEDVLDGVEILDEAFHRLFVGPDIDARAQAINVAMGSTRKS